MVLHDIIFKCFIENVEFRTVQGMWCGSRFKINESSADTHYLTHKCHYCGVLLLWTQHEAFDSNYSFANNKR